MAVRLRVEIVTDASGIESSDVKKTGHLRKMRTALTSPVSYFLILDGEEIPLNPLIGQSLTLTHTGAIHCVSCGRKTKKSFGQGHCYPCFRDLPECDSCIMKPELCHFSEGTCRDAEWGQANCMQPHYVYLANSSGVKVGITRHSQIPTRWMDQGAVEALPIIKVKDRKTSGLVEVMMKNHVADKTHWQKMLKGKADPVDLAAKRDELLEAVQSDLNALSAELGEGAIQTVTDDQVDIHYPVETYPTKVKSFNFDKTPEVSGVLQGIKGQYLIFDSGVINIRKFGGYEVEVTVAP